MGFHLVWILEVPGKWVLCIAGRYLRMEINTLRGDQEGPKVGAMESLLQGSA